MKAHGKQFKCNTIPVILPYTDPVLNYKSYLMSYLKTQVA